MNRFDIDSRCHRSSWRAAWQLHLGALPQNHRMCHCSHHHALQPDAMEAAEENRPLVKHSMVLMGRMECHLSDNE